VAWSLSARGLLQDSVGLGGALAVGEFVRDDGGAGELAGVVVGVGAGQLAAEYL